VNVQWAIAFGLMATGLTTALNPQSPRDQVPKSAATGSIEGVVVDDRDHKAIRRAIVTLTGGGILPTQQFVTGETGQFVFDDLSAGKYNITAEKPGYLQSSYGATRPLHAGSPISLAPGERVGPFRIELSRGAVISGVVFDPNGEPVANATVVATRVSKRGDEKVFVTSRTMPSMTDERGAYRIFGLATGDYAVGAVAIATPSGPQSVIQLGDADVDRALREARDPSGVARPVEPPHQIGLAATYFPSTPDGANAETISVTAGEERAGVNVQLRLAPMARITGSVSIADGQPLPSGIQILLTPLGPAINSLGFRPPAGTARLDPQGRFSYASIPPGSYVLSARTSSTQGSDTTSGPLWAIVNLTIAGTDQDIPVTLRPGATLRGRVIFDRRADSPKPNSSDIKLSIQAASPGAGVTLGAPSASINSDNQFELRGVAPGTYRLAASVAGKSGTVWSFKSADLSGHDVSETPFQIVNGQAIDGLNVTLTDRPTEVLGRVQSAQGLPTNEIFVVIAATDKAWWYSQSRRIAAVKPDNLGGYSARGLPPGEYFVSALTDLEPGEWLEYSLLQQLANSSPIRVTLAAGEKKSVDLRLSK
jgi:hypothetical protein